MRPGFFGGLLPAGALVVVLGLAAPVLGAAAAGELALADGVEPAGVVEEPEPPEMVVLPEGLLAEAVPEGAPVATTPADAAGVGVFDWAVPAVEGFTTACLASATVSLTAWAAISAGMTAWTLVR